MIGHFRDHMARRKSALTLQRRRADVCAPTHPGRARRRQCEFPG
jgi:hypothetical protein